MKKNRYFVRMIRVMAMMLALFTGAGGAWCTLAGMLTAYAKGMEKPTLNAAVSDGVISIQAQSGDSAIQKIMVNGYEFDDVWNGTLNTRNLRSRPQIRMETGRKPIRWPTRIIKIRSRRRMETVTLEHSFRSVRCLRIRVLQRLK